MSGPYPLSQLNQVIKNKTETGAYVLSRDGKTSHLIGRSEGNLAERISKHAGESYSHFWYELAESPIQAFHLECEWFHKYHPTDNPDHPTVTPGATWRCPVLGCPKS